MKILNKVLLGGGKDKLPEDQKDEKKTMRTAKTKRVREVVDGAKSLDAGGVAAGAATLTDSLSPSSVWKTVVPQTGQNLNVNLAPWSPTRTYSVRSAKDLVGGGEAGQRCKDTARSTLTGEAMADADSAWFSLNFDAQPAAGTRGCSRTH